MRTVVRAAILVAATFVAAAPGVRGDLIVSNLGTLGLGAAVGPTPNFLILADALAQEFTVDSSSHALGSIAVVVGNFGNDPSPIVSLYADGGGTPGDLIHNLNYDSAASGPHSRGGWKAVYLPTSGNVVLDADATYFVHMTAPSGNRIWWTSPNGSETAAMGSASIANLALLSYDGGTTWFTSEPNETPFQIEIAAAVPEASSALLVAVVGGGCSLAGYARRLAIS